MAWSGHPILDTPYHLLKTKPMVCVHTPQGPSFVPMHSQMTADENMGEDRHCSPPPYQLPNSNATIFWGNVSTGMCGGTQGGLNGVSCNGLGILGGMNSGGGVPESRASDSSMATTVDGDMQFAYAPTSMYKDGSFNPNTPATATPSSTPRTCSSSPCPTPPLLSHMSSFSSIEEGSLERSPLACSDRCPTTDTDDGGGAFPPVRSKRTFESLVGSIGEVLSCGGQFVQYGRGVMGPGEQIGGSKERRLGDTTKTTSHDIGGRGGGDMAMF
eukprot:GHVS01076629.1.p1 GENE.GHVS01076629.1~~GHVS01076629.1.p1  ORF type:complete len:271 (-),score=51.72 GHVS01076629.1:309-1121(-)